MGHRRYATVRLAYAPRMDADAIELRVLGCLLEKQRTTPDQYPLTLNALRLACNQTTNRDPLKQIVRLRRDLGTHSTSPETSAQCALVSGWKRGL